MECPDELCYKMLAEVHSVIRCNVVLLLARTRRDVLQVLVREIGAMLCICRFELDIKSARRIRTRVGRYKIISINYIYKKGN